ncbi:hypothetical protein QUA43_00530 [Microcoleus sp. N9_B4]|uniref:hypothetical protein n=1 Tax=Microcoleus sp. N9_B4 TaxID=3055386 RepID=UPI002FD70E9C
MKPIIKVDRVKSVEEAVELESLGVDIVSISLGEDVRFDDNRQVSENLACEIRKSLSSSKACCQLALNEESLSFIKDYNFDLIQLLEFELHSIDRHFLKEDEVRIIYSGITASHDDAPSWIFSSFENEDCLNASYFHLDLLADLENSWSFLKHECPKYSDTLQISDINNLASQYPILIGLNPSIEAIQDCLNIVPNICGINFTLASEPINNNVHWLDYSSLINILQALRSGS